MPITGGQEVAMAIEDAASLAYVLGRCNSGQLRKNLLEIWERHRMQRVEWVVSTKDFILDPESSNILPKLERF